MSSRKSLWTRCISIITLAVASVLGSAAQPGQAGSFLGFDRNEYPGDQSLSALRKSFDYTGYWLNNPPGDTRNSWTGKRSRLKQEGFGFLVLYNARLYAALKGSDAAGLGAMDGREAAASAAREGFPKSVRIFLDEEEGGRLVAAQAAYLFAWVDAVRATGARVGIYCSGIEVPDGTSTISTASDIFSREIARANESKVRSLEPRLALWVANDQCPPSPGCTATHLAPSAGIASSAQQATTVWQYAQSPRRAEFSAQCPKNAGADGNCYAPGMAHNAHTFLDLNTANSPDPSEAP